MSVTASAGTGMTGNMLSILTSLFIQTVIITDM